MNSRKISASYKAWDILVDLANEHRTIYYQDLGDQIGYSPQSVGSVLSLLQNHCIWKDIPPITVLVINKETDMPGIGYRERYGRVEKDTEETFKYKWKNIPENLVYKYDKKYD
ncbi:hypothetical protein KHQ88_01155 [Mycoplasmatota bacterium]|nr:hypothetical protein KHQ88_01155 [Mycoplasmatota bacterium]